MKINIYEDPKISETEIIINCATTDESIIKIISMLRVLDKKITGMKKSQTFILETEKILYIESVDKKTFMYTKNDIYESSLRLYELEDKLAGNDFFRVSKSMILNFNQIKSLRPDFGGKMLVTMNNNEAVYVSRQYVPTIKRKLGLI